MSGLLVVFTSSWRMGVSRDRDRDRNRGQGQDRDRAGHEQLSGDGATRANELN